MIPQQFQYQSGQLFVEGCSLEQLARDFGTPLFVYSRAIIEQNFRAYQDALGDGQVCYAVKANSNLSLLRLLARLGAGFDIVSGGELQRVLRAGGDPGKVVFSGVGKREEEIAQALEAGIQCFNVESEAELELLNQVAGRLGCVAPISLRVNPDVDAGTHPYIATGLAENKFGIEHHRAVEVYTRAADLANLRIVGIDCHIGSQLTELAPFRDAVRKVLALIDVLAAQGITLEHLDMGGGLGVSYADEQPPSIAEYLAVMRDELGARPLKLMVEPGRSIVAAAGALLTRVILTKGNGSHNFAVVDAAMTENIRPALYSAWQEVVAVTPRGDCEPQQWDIVGPVCETGDFLGKGRTLALRAGDLLCQLHTGAYGFVMSSNYNSRPRPAEVLVEGGRARIVRRAETVDSLFALEAAELEFDSEA